MHVGTLEVWLVSPENLPQLGTGPEVADAKKRNTSQGIPSNQSEATSSGAPSNNPTEQKQNECETKTENEGDYSDEQTNGINDDQQSHNAIRWNASDNMGTEGGRSGAVTVPESGPHPKKPLATYCVSLT